jgi:hypothetical protein
VCDMVLDRVVSEVQRTTARMMVSEEGEAENFNMLNFGSEFLQHLAEQDDRGWSSLRTCWC